jgi:FKBP-type peptidyl-prolyl cis-trans isomerase
MGAQRVFIVIGACIVVAGLGVGLVLLDQHNDDIRPVTNKVGTVSATAQSSQTTGSGISVGNASPSNGIGQAGNPLNSGTSATSGSQAQIEAMTNPSTFSQYNTPKYESANEALYANLQVGTGTTLSKSGQKAVISYKGWLTNGTLFDETKVNAQGQSEAFEFTYDTSPEQVIPGFDEGLGGMKVGGIRLLVVPPAAGYGSTAHDSIPANSVLIFEVTLDEIQ